MSESIIQELIRLEMIKPHMLRYAHMVHEIKRISEPGLELYSADGAIANVADRSGVDVVTVKRALDKLGGALDLYLDTEENIDIEVREQQEKVRRKIGNLLADIALNDEKHLRVKLSDCRKELARLYRTETYLRGKT